MNSNTINHQPLFGKNSNVINSPKNINNNNPSIVGSNRSLSPVPSITLQQQQQHPSSVLLQSSSSTTFNNNNNSNNNNTFSIHSPMSGSIASPFNMMFSNSNNNSNNNNKNNNNNNNSYSVNSNNITQGLISNEHTPLRLMNSPVSANGGSINNISSIRSKSVDTHNTISKSPSTGLVTKSYKFDDNSKELHKTILYIKNKKSFVKSKQVVDKVFFELLNRLANRAVSIRSNNDKKNRSNSTIDTNLVTFNGNDKNTNIVHISNNTIKNNSSDKLNKKTELSATHFSSSPQTIATNNNIKEKTPKVQQQQQQLQQQQETEEDQVSANFYKECDLCPKIFNNPHTFKMHKKQHVIMNGGKNVCPKCYKGFARTDAMKRHLGTKTCDRNRRKLIEDNNGVMPDRPPSEVVMERELDS
ncbi:hypothetical protein HANVADRAFT_52476 [Hanseniaspora valbyensis NRRL Y-1626]|uniref:C2H2-type domain-containing protein n=1 Tax=Hanseniaspora valbyensis NRRL Y-1626 TaxID=766949 RepID=A0A1B7TEM0_9ASCO|nr:hypothetical protein HANVADRAFT_52476 [Hanseniaspora valbyensis NRRL Y-1626]